MPVGVYVRVQRCSAVEVHYWAFQRVVLHELEEQLEVLALVNAVLRSFEADGDLRHALLLGEVGVDGEAGEGGGLLEHLELLFKAIFVHRLLAVFTFDTSVAHYAGVFSVMLPPEDYFR